MAFNLQPIVTASTLIAIICTCFLLGILYSDWPISYYVLWTVVNPDVKSQDEIVKLVLDHYLLWLEIPKFIPYTMYVVTAIGFLAFAVKIVSPTPDVMYFEYGSFLVYVLCVSAYISNVRFGALSAQAGEWGEVDEFTGLSVIMATEVMMAVMLLGIVVIQAGLFYAKYEDDRVKTQFLIQELKMKLEKSMKEDQENAKNVKNETPTVVKATGAKKHT